MPRYKTHVGLSYPENPRAKPENQRKKRVEAGEIVDDIPAGATRDWLEETGLIVPVDDELGETEAADGEIR